MASVYSHPAAPQLLYELLRERSEEHDAVVNISHRALPPYKQHLAFMRSKPYRAWYLVKADGIAIGNVTLGEMNEIGIVLARAHRGKGYGKQALRLLLERYQPRPAIPARRVGQFIAHINPKNEASIRLFTGLGFALKQQTYQL